MFKTLKPLSKVTGWSVPSGSANTAHTVVCEVQPGERIHKILITGNAGTAKKMTDLLGDIRVIVNDEVVRLHSAAELNALNALYGPQFAAVNGNLAAGTFQLPIYLAEPWRKNDLVGEKLAWNTRNVRTMRVECDTKADTFTAAVALSFLAEVDRAPLDQDAPGLMGLIKKVDRTTINLAAGWNDCMSFPRRGVYQEINIGTAADVTNAEIKIGSEVVVGPATLAQLRAQAVQADCEPIYRAATSPATTTIGGTDHATTRSMTDIIFDVNDRLDSGLIPDPSKDFNVRLQCTSGGNTTILYQRLDSL